MSNPGVVERLGPTFFGVGFATLWAYACCFLLDERIGGITIGLGILTLVFVAGLVFIATATRSRLVKRLVPPTRMLDVGLAGFMLVLAIVAGDLAITARANWTASTTPGLVTQDVRERDSTIWHGELYPRMFVPAGQNFFLYKPNVRVSGETYGERYMSSMRASRTLVDGVLERRQLSYFIGPTGLRELEPLSQSRIFALGDSFVFGFATDEGKIWPDLLGASLGEPIYNLGVSATGPRQQLQLLEYLLKTNPESMHVGHLLWMIFEGNDLENSYADIRAESPTRAATGVFDGTVLEALLSLPGRVKNESILRRLVRGELTLSAGGSRYGRYEIDGVALPIPLFHSSRFGYRLFVPADMDVATKPREYVLNHPNRPLLDKTFRQMRELGRKLGFKVTVVIAPSDARLYGAAFDGFPPLSPEPYFIDYVAKLGDEMGFSVVNLLPLLQPIAKTEMLYYRDDHHWNARGNQVVAQLLATALAQHDDR